MTTEEPLAEALLEAMSEAVYVVDRRRRITYWNPAAERLTGFSAEEVVGRLCRDGILNHVDSEGKQLCRGRCPLLATMRDGEPREACVFLHHRDGHRVPVDVRAAPLRDADGVVRGAVEVFHDDSRSHSLAERLDDAERTSLVDPLTGLGNRRLVQRSLDRHASDLDRHGELFSVVFADIDHFKQVNDAHGHDIGDQVLQQVAATLARCCRPCDMVGRWGGEEFLVLAPVADEAEAMALAERFRHLVGTLWVETREARISVTLSLGVAVARPSEVCLDVVKRADVAMLEAKSQGRDRTVLG